MAKDLNMDLLKMLQSPKSQGDAIKVLYKEFPKIKALICGSGGTKQEVEEVFDDAIILLIEKVNDQEFVLTSKLTTFFYGINRFLWLNALKKKNRNISLEWNDTIIVTANDIDYDEGKEEKITQIESALKLVTKKCQELFKRFYYKGEKLSQVADALGYSSVNSAKTQKYKCMEQLQKKVKYQF